MTQRVCISKCSRNWKPQLKLSPLIISSSLLAGCIQLSTKPVPVHEFTHVAEDWTDDIVAAAVYTVWQRRKSTASHLARPAERLATRCKHASLVIHASVGRLTYWTSLHNSFKRFSVNVIILQWLYIFAQSSTDTKDSEIPECQINKPKLFCRS